MRVKAQEPQAQSTGSLRRVSLGDRPCGRTKNPKEGRAQTVRVKRGRGGGILEGFLEEAGLELGLEGGMEVSGLRMMAQSKGSEELCRPELAGAGWGGVLMVSLPQHSI